MLRKLTVMALALCLALSFAAAANAAKVYDRVMESKEVRAGIQTTGKPFGFHDENNKWVGFDMDVAQEIAKRLGVKLVPVKVDNNTRIEFLLTGKIDMSLSNMTHKRERDKNIDFSITYFFDGQKMLAPKGKYNDLKDFVGKKIATMQGTTSEINLKNLLKELGDPDPNVVSYQDEQASFAALQKGIVDAWSTDSTLLLGYAAQAPGKYELVGDFFSDEPYGIGVPQDDSKWRDTLNFIIQDMWKDGTYMVIYNKWFGPQSPYPFPMTETIEMWP